MARIFNTEPGQSRYDQTLIDCSSLSSARKEQKLACGGTVPEFRESWNGSEGYSEMVARDGTVDEVLVGVDRRDAAGHT